MRELAIKEVRVHGKVRVVVDGCQFEREQCGRADLARSQLQTHILAEHTSYHIAPEVTDQVYRHLWTHDL